MKNKDYWKQRSINLENLMQRNANQTMIAINKIYQKASDSLTRKVNRIFTRYVTGGKINPEYAKQLLNEKQTREYRNELKRLLAETQDEKFRREIVNTLDAPAYGARISRLEALRDNLYYEARAIGAKEVELAESRLANVYEQSYYRTIYADQKNSGLYDFDILTDRRIQTMLSHEWNGGNYSSRLWKNNEDFAERVAETIETGCLAGWTLDEMCNELKGRVIGDNSDKAQRFITSRLVRTEVNYFSNQGTLEGLKAAGFTKYRFIATLDLRTSEMCRKLDLKVFNIDDAEIGVNLPPLHPFCRSVIVPAYENENRTGRTRWARNPVTGKGTKVPADMSYDEWYKKYVLGNGLKANDKDDIINPAGKSPYIDTMLTHNPDATYEINLEDYSETVCKGISKECKRVAEQGYIDNNEHLSLVNLKTGKTEYMEDGLPSSVGGTDFWKFIADHKEQTYAFVHNHNNPTKFSEADLITLTGDNCIDMFVISRYDGKIFVLESNGIIRPTSFFDDLYIEEVKEINRKVRIGKYTAGDKTYQRERMIVENAIKDFTKGLKEFG
ncbi:MAG: minor capsid protein [Eubacterium sp.]|nr:minor capsid protein [Eubacterium sp.]